MELYCTTWTTYYALSHVILVLSHTIVIHRWQLFEPLVQLPTESLKFKPSTADVASTARHTELLLRESDILYLPRGVLHEAVTPKDEAQSLHLTVGLLPADADMQSLLLRLLDVVPSALSEKLLSVVTRSLGNHGRRVDGGDGGEGRGGEHSDERRPTREDDDVGAGMAGAARGGAAAMASELPRALVRAVARFPAEGALRSYVPLWLADELFTAAGASHVGRLLERALQSLDATTTSALLLTRTACGIGPSLTELPPVHVATSPLAQLCATVSALNASRAATEFPDQAMTGAWVPLRRAISEHPLRPLLEEHVSQVEDKRRQARLWFGERLHWHQAQPLNI